MFSPIRCTVYQLFFIDVDIYVVEDTFEWGSLCVQPLSRYSSHETIIQFSVEIHLFYIAYALKNINRPKYITIVLYKNVDTLKHPYIAKRHLLLSDADWLRRINSEC
jgi:hypothetical protein